VVNLVTSAFTTNSRGAGNEESCKEIKERKREMTLAQLLAIVGAAAVIIIGVWAKWGAMKRAVGHSSRFRDERFDTTDEACKEGK
jgi:hypothetical protein